MIQKPRLKGNLSLFPISEVKGALLLGGEGSTGYVELADETAIRTFGSLLPWLNGKHDLEAILEKSTAAGGDRNVALLILSRLEEHHRLEDGGNSGLSSAEREQFADQIAYFSQFGSAGGGRAQKKLLDSRVALMAGGVLSGILHRHLEEAGVGEVRLLAPTDPSAVWPAGSPFPELLIMPQETHDPELLEGLNAFSCRHRVPWLLVRSLSVQEGWVGPLFLPGETASYLSLEARLRGNLPFFDEYQAFDQYVRSSGRPGPANGALRPNLEILSGIAVGEVIKFLTQYQSPGLAGRFLSVNLMSWETELHQVLRVPHMDEADSPEYQQIPWKKEAVYE